jgi:hypothetical protein
VLKDIDGVDVVIGLNFLYAHSIDVRSKDLAISIPTHSGPIIVKSAPQAPAFSHFSTEHVDVISGARLAKLTAHEKGEVFIGYIKELNHAPEAPEPSAAVQPAAYAPFEAELLREFADVIRDEVPPGLPPERTLPDGRKIEHHIPLKPDTKPISQQPYKLSPVELDEVHKTLTKLTNQGWIRPALSPWGSPVLFQRKKSGKLRMCVDYRALNHGTVKYAYPMPLIDELLEKLQGYQVVSKLDLSEGFHQIRVAPEDVYKTAFVTQYGAYEYLVMPFGLANAPAQFTLLMNYVLQGIDFVVVFMDDILVYSKSLEDHHAHVRVVLERLREHKLYCAPKKCEFYRTSVEYLGHVITTDGTTVVPSKAKAIEDWPQPENLKQLRQFLGLSGFYRHFIDQYSKISKPLTDLLAAHTPFVWGSRQQQAFQELKIALTTAPVLIFPDPSLPFTVSTDASDFAIGAVLQQDQGRGLQPIAFLSRKLNSAERNYPVHEKELLAIVFALKHSHWRHHLQGAQHTVTVLTDHVTLKYFHKQPKLSQRQVRWTELFADFDLDIKYKPGRENVVPDALSRRPDLKVVLCALLGSHSTSSPFPDTSFLKKLRLALAKDETTARLMENASKDDPSYRNIHGLLYLLDDRRYRLYVPNDVELKNLLLHDHHEAPAAAHPGVQRTYEGLKLHFYWPQMLEDVRSYVRSCRHCQLVKPAALPVAPLTTFPIPKTPFEEIVLDFVGPLPLTERGNDFLLNTSCRLTKFAISIPCSQEISKIQLAEILFYEVFCRYGIPLVIVSDRDPRLDNPFFSQLAALQGTRQRLTTAHRPQGNGQAEALNKEFLNKLRAYCYDPARSEDWDVTIPHMSYAYNTTVHSVTGLTPFFALHGYHPSSVYSLYVPALESPFPSKGDARSVSDVRRHHAQCLMQAHARLEQDAVRRRNASLPPSHRLPKFSVGDQVCISVVHLPTDSFDSKLSPRFVGPFEITSIPYPYVYQLNMGFKFPHVHPRVSADLIKPFVQPSACALRPGEADFPIVGDASRDIEVLLARAPARGRPPQKGRRSYQYKCRFKALDALYDLWLTEKNLRLMHPESAPALIAACDARY